MMGLDTTDTSETGDVPKYHYNLFTCSGSRHFFSPLKKCSEDILVQTKFHCAYYT